MPAVATFQDTLTEGEPYIPVARITKADGSNLVQADVSSIALKLFALDSATPDVAYSTTAPVVATTIFNTLQTDGYWGRDSTGYNFRDSIPPATHAAEGGQRYLFEYVFTLSSGGPIVRRWEVRVMPTFSG